MQHLEYTAMPIAELTPYPGNAKEHDLDELRRSLRKGQFQPIVVRRLLTSPDTLSHTILSGHGTYEAAKLEDWKEIEAKVISCSDEEALWINLAANKIGERAGYNDEALVELLEQLNGEFAGTGWEADDLDDLLAALDQVTETAYTPTQAAYNETEEETVAREEMGSGMSLAARGIRETVIILPQDEHDELHSLLVKCRANIKEEEITNGQIVLRAMRALNASFQVA